MVCSGLDHAMRGFESFARECFDVLRDDPGLDIELVKGSGPPGDRERSVPTLTRDSPLAQALGRLTGREPFRFEHAQFALSVLPLVLRRRPHVIYLSEWHTALVLAWLRRATGRRFKLVLNNGTMAWTGFDHLDHVQQLTPAAVELVLEHGADPARQSMLPLGFDIEPGFEPVGDEERAALRARLGLPAGRRIVVSVAALNRHHKRMDYLIEEVARLPEDERPFVLLVGQAEAETDGIRALAAERLGGGGHSIRTVPQREVRDLSRASDAFVLASLGEGLPRALIEATATGLPCLTHDYGVTRFALGPHGRFADFSRPGGLAGLLRSDVGERDPAAARERHRYAYENFGWDSLRPRYVELLRRVAADPPL
jgi:glycosyltransferase involved in cell wall biosynthesis